MDQNTQKVGGNPIPICHLPFESLTNIPTSRFANVNIEENSFMTSSVLLCNGHKFVHLCRTFGKDQFLNKINLIVIDNVHEALRDVILKKELLEILDIIR